MKKILLLPVTLLLLSLTAKATQHTVINSGNTFTPDTITIGIGDTVNFTLGTYHNVVEVSESTYDANENTSNGGFSLPYGGGTLIFENAGTFYYVCTPHAIYGMKGIIQVGALSELSSPSVMESSFEIFPNPAASYITLSYVLRNPSHVDIDLLSITGAVVDNLANELQSAGSQELTLRLNKQLAPGIYFIKIKTNESELVRKLMIE